MGYMKDNAPTASVVEILSAQNEFLTLTSTLVVNLTDKIAPVLRQANTYDEVEPEMAKPSSGSSMVYELIEVNNITINNINERIRHLMERIQL